MMLGEERRAVVAYCRRMVADGLVVGTSGNISARRGELIAVTPSGLAYEELTPELVGVHRLDGTPVDAPLPPTTELPTHLAAYRATGGNAVVHTHSTAATAVATLVDELPSVHYLVALFGGPIRVARYATYGTDDLADSVTEALTGRTGCLLGNHGTIAVGDTLAKAYAKAQYLEWLCDVWLRAKAAGEPRVLDAAEIDRVSQKLASYGATVHDARGDVTEGDATPDPR
ncbi:class II aldolase/adducin family protein [Hamadaea sp. NPDC051192]|uniref:class II aldolase/adducin family protein n=1 Tax=Hamadaea sp. NPDC051192 TaxID=3154940 RepID=UPI0034148EC5